MTKWLETVRGSVQVQLAAAVGERIRVQLSGAIALGTSSPPAAPTGSELVARRAGFRF